ncbi:MAG: ZPR1 zinc finger domain-containing protein [Candidatus Woesearchaeota archaeon]
MSEEQNISCPICGTGRLTVNSMLYSVPFFNELAMFTIKCNTCNFTHNDVFSAEDRPPSRWTLRVGNERLLRVRVVRSSSGTIRMPEFGIVIEPGPGADSFISNVEGVLSRTRPVVETAVRFACPKSKLSGYFLRSRQNSQRVSIQSRSPDKIPVLTCYVKKA